MLRAQQFVFAHHRGFFADDSYLLRADRIYRGYRRPRDIAIAIRTQRGPIMAKVHKGAKHHENAAEHHERAAFHHREAAKHYRNDDHAHAAHQALAAHARLQQAAHQANEAGRYHALRYGPTPPSTRQPKRDVRVPEHRPGVLMPR